MTKLVLTDRLEEVTLKFSDLLELLPERQFQPCHRSYLVPGVKRRYIKLDMHVQNNYFVFTCENGATPNWINKETAPDYKTFCEKKEILLPTTRGQRRIPLANILYAEAMERMTKLVLTDRLRSEVAVYQVGYAHPKQLFRVHLRERGHTGLDQQRNRAVTVWRRTRKCFTISWRSIITCSFCRRMTS